MSCINHSGSPVFIRLSVGKAYQSNTLETEFESHVLVEPIQKFLPREAQIHVAPGPGIAYTPNPDRDPLYYVRIIIAKVVELYLPERKVLTTEASVLYLSQL